MPLDGFHILHWADETFGSMPPLAVGAAGLVLLLVGIAVLATGLRAHPTSFDLALAGAGTAAVAYFILHAAASMASTVAQESSGAQRLVPWAAAAAVSGFGLWGLRKARGSWGDDSGKVAGALVGLASLAALFVAVQIVRGSYARPVALPATDSAASPAP